MEKLCACLVRRLHSAVSLSLTHTLSLTYMHGMVHIQRTCQTTCPAPHILTLHRSCIEILTKLSPLPRPDQAKRMQTGEGCHLALASLLQEHVPMCLCAYVPMCLCAGKIRDRDRTPLEPCWGADLRTAHFLLCLCACLSFVHACLWHASTGQARAELARKRWCCQRTFREATHGSDQLDQHTVSRWH